MQMPFKFLFLYFIYLKITNKKAYFHEYIKFRTLYILDKIIPSKINVIDWQYKYIYKYLFKKNKFRRVSFKYGNFEFRASHRLRCKKIFPFGQNTELSKKLKYAKNGDIIIIHNPNREFKYWLNLNNIIKCSNTKKNIFL